MWYTANPNISKKKLQIITQQKIPPWGTTFQMRLCFVALSFKWLCFWTGDSNNPLHLFDPLSPAAYGNKVVVVGCTKLATPHANMFCCLPFRNFNAKRKWYCKGGNFTLATKVRKNLVDGINYNFIFCGFQRICEFQDDLPCRLFVFANIIYGAIISKPAFSTIVFGNYNTPCKVPIFITIDPFPMFR